MKLTPHKELKNTLTGKCSRCGYLFTMDYKDLGIIGGSIDITVICPKCNHKQKLESE